MTTTGMYSGLNEDSRNSSRVLRPPGGASSNIFGTDPAAPPPRKNNPQQNSSIFGGGDDDRFSAQQEAAPAKPSSATSHDKLFGDPSPQAQAGKPQGAYNPITGQAYANASKPQTDSPPVPSTKVRQPPGGASSGLW